LWSAVLLEEWARAAIKALAPRDEHRPRRDRLAARRMARAVPQAPAVAARLYLPGRKRTWHVLAAREITASADIIMTG